MSQALSHCSWEFLPSSSENCWGFLGVEIKLGFHPGFWCFCGSKVRHVGEVRASGTPSRGAPPGAFPCPPRALSVQRRRQELHPRGSLLLGCEDFWGPVCTRGPGGHSNCNEQKGKNEPIRKFTVTLRCVPGKADAAGARPCRPSGACGQASEREPPPVSALRSLRLGLAHSHWLAHSHGCI